MELKSTCLKQCKNKGSLLDVNTQKAKLLYELHRRNTDGHTAHCVTRIDRLYRISYLRWTWYAWIDRRFFGTFCWVFLIWFFKYGLGCYSTSKVEIQISLNLLKPLGISVYLYKLWKEIKLRIWFKYHEVVIQFSFRFSHKYKFRFSQDWLVHSRFKKAWFEKESRFKKDCWWNRFFST